MTNQKRKLAVLLATLLCSVAVGKADVNLAFSLTSANPSVNGTFTLRLDLITTAGEQVTGLDYFFQQLTSAGFRIISRDTAGSAFSFLYFTDAQVSLAPGSILDPRNDLDLGGGVADVNTPTGGGLVANYTLQAPAVNGVYTISTFSNPGTGWVGPGPNFNDNAFNQQASIAITVVPEPSTLALAALGLSGLGVCAYRRARRA